MQAPDVVEKLSFEQIFSRMKEELVHRDSTFSALIESDPAMRILEIAAWRELLLRKRINEAAQSNLLKFATGNDLDYLAEFYGVERNVEESDERFRKRIKAKIIGWSTGGSKEHYRFHALSADIRVKDALVESLVPGNVQISILSTDGVPSEELLENVKKQLNKEDIRILTDTIEVVSCNIIPIDIYAKITAISEDVIEMAKKQFIEKFESAKGLGSNVTKSWIIANLFVEGMQNVELIEPSKDIVVQGNESTLLNSLEIELVKN
jgi:phage-related baseplate assembly protein